MDYCVADCRLRAYIPMNRAQKNIYDLAQRVYQTDTNSLEFLRGCYKAWSGYDDSSYSYPAHQLRGLEKKYGTTMAEIALRYKE